MALTRGPTGKPRAPSSSPGSIYYRQTSSQRRETKNAPSRAGQSSSRLGWAPEGPSTGLAVTVDDVPQGFTYGFAPVAEITFVSKSTPANTMAPSASSAKQRVTPRVVSPRVKFTPVGPLWVKKFGHRVEWIPLGGLSDKNTFSFVLK